VFVFGIALTEEESVVEEDDLAINILDDDEESLGTSVDLFIPSEVRNY